MLSNGKQSLEQEVKIILPLYKVFIVSCRFKKKCWTMGVAGPWSWTVEEAGSNLISILRNSFVSIWEHLGRCDGVLTDRQERIMNEKV